MEQDKIRGFGSDIEFIVIDEIEKLEELARLKQKAWDSAYNKQRAFVEEMSEVVLNESSSEMGGMWDETLVLDGLPELTKAEIDVMNSVAADIAAPQNRSQRRARNSRLRKLETRKVRN